MKSDLWIAVLIGIILVLLIITIAIWEVKW